MLALLKNPKGTKLRRHCAHFNFILAGVGQVGQGLDGLGVISQAQEFKFSPVWNGEEIVQIIGIGSKTFKPWSATKRIWKCVTSESPQKRIVLRSCGIQSPLSRRKHSTFQF